jgi:hypothetical protein
MAWPYTLKERVAQLEGWLAEREDVARHLKERGHVVPMELQRAIALMRADLGWLRELRARRIAAGREPDDELNAPADMCCCGHCLVGPKPEFRDGCPLHPRPELTDDREVVDAEGRQLTTFSSRDSCGAVETGDLCGGCGSCIRMQAERSGHTVRPLHPPATGAEFLEQAKAALGGGLELREDMGFCVGCGSRDCICEPRS